MKKDFSYGIIPLMQQGDTWYTIMIKLASGDHRGLPKGHGEAGETPLESAMRELYEETGLILSAEQVDSTNEYTEHYTCYSKRHNHDVDKTVIYYTGILPYTDVSKLSGYSEGDGEILDKKILPLTEAIELATYDATREILQKIYNILE